MASSAGAARAAGAAGAAGAASQPNPRKGAKLDFKDPAAVAPCIHAAAAAPPHDSPAWGGGSGKDNTRLWLNADILQGR